MIKKDNGNAQSDFGSIGRNAASVFERQRLVTALRQRSSASAAAATEISELDKCHVLEKWMREVAEPFIV